MILKSQLYPKMPCSGSDDVPKQMRLPELNAILVFSMGDLAKDEIFRKRKVSNYYEKVRVCYYCYNMYKKIDTLRTRVCACESFSPRKFTSRKRRKTIKEQIFSITPRFKRRSWRLSKIKLKVSLLSQVKCFMFVITLADLQKSNKLSKFSELFYTRLQEFEADSLLPNTFAETRKIQSVSLFHKDRRLKEEDPGGPVSHCSEILSWFYPISFQPSLRRKSTWSRIIFLWKYGLRWNQRVSLWLDLNYSLVLFLRWTMKSCPI